MSKIDKNLKTLLLVFKLRVFDRNKIPCRKYADNSYRSRVFRSLKYLIALRSDLIDSRFSIRKKNYRNHKINNNFSSVRDLPPRTDGCVIQD